MNIQNQKQPQNLLLVLITVIMVAFFFTACQPASSSSSDPADETTPSSSSVVRIENLALEDPLCANGGQTIYYGIDTNNNGTLDEGESNGSVTICNGENGISGINGLSINWLGSLGSDPVSPEVNDAYYNTVDGKSYIWDGDSWNIISQDGTNGTNGLNALINLTTLEPGDDNKCVNGGWKLEVGIDNNRNAILDVSEVNTSSTVYSPTCVSMVAPSGADGTAVIDTSGGNILDASGDFSIQNGSGGNGGNLAITLSSIQSNTTIKILKTGKADASFSFPTIYIDLGSVPLDVTTDLRIDVTDGTGDTPFYHFETEDQTLYYYNGYDSIPVTGIHVYPNATLTLSTNCNSDRSCISVINDIYNEGTITTDIESGGNRSNLQIWASIYYGTLGSSIELGGDPSNDESNGGYLEIDKNSDFSGFYNRGTINTSGVSGNSGSNAGPVAISMNQAFFIYNEGDIYANGGTGSNGPGGSGANVTLNAKYGVYNSGDINTSGGNASGSVGPGTGGNISIVTVNGNIQNSGQLTTSGGSYDSPPSMNGEYNGQPAGSISLLGYGGSLITEGDLISSGGDGILYGYGGYGGAGGSIQIVAVTSTLDNFGFVPVEKVHVSGNMDTTGGNGFHNAMYPSGVTAGYGGNITIDISSDNYDQTAQEIALFGYANIKLDGGVAPYQAGTAGSLIAQQQNGDSDLFPYPTGGIYNEVNVSALGGLSTADNSSYGGNGGMVVLKSDFNYRGSTIGSEFVVNRGNLTLSGGNGLNGGNGGAVHMLGFDRVENYGTITSNGGNGGSEGSGNADAGSAAICDLMGFCDENSDNGIIIQSAMGLAIQSASITANGGDASYDSAYGGGAGNINIRGETIDVSGDFSLQGGSALTPGFARGGGLIQLFGDLESNIDNVVEILNGGSDVSDDACNGRLYLNGINQTVTSCDYNYHFSEEVMDIY